MVRAIESSSILKKEILLYKKWQRYSNYILRFVSNRKQFYLHHGNFSFLFCYFGLYQLSLNPVCRVPTCWVIAMHIFVASFANTVCNVEIVLWTIYGRDEICMSVYWTLYFKALLKMKKWEMISFAIKKTSIKNVFLPIQRFNDVSIKKQNCVGCKLLKNAYICKSF